MRFLQKFLQKLFRNHFKDKDLKELLKGGASVLVLKITGMFLGYLTMIFITNKFGAKIYGEYALGITILSVSVLLPRFGLDTALVRIIGELKLFGQKREIINVLRKAFSVTFLIGFLLSFILFYFSKDIAIEIFNKPDLVNELSLIKWIITPLALLYLIASYFQAHKKVVLYILFNTVLLNINFFILLIVLEFLNIETELFYTYTVSVLITFVIAILFLIANVVFLKNEIHNKTHKPQKYSLKKILKTSSPMLLSSSFALLINWLDVIMLGILSNEESVGIYNVSQRLATLSTIALFAINAIATPKFVELFTKKDYTGLENVTRNSTKLIFYSTTPILLVFIVFPKTILSINGVEFISGYMALVFLCIGKFVNSISGSVGFILQMTNNQVIFKNVLLFAAILNGILNYLLIPKYGYNGAAFASMITVATWNIILVIIVKQKLGFWTFYLPLIRK